MINKIQKIQQNLANLSKKVKVKPKLQEAVPTFWKGTNQNYNKFIIIAHARSGSSMLIGALREHPQIMGFGEIFHPKEITFNIQDYDNNSVHLLNLRNNYPLEFLNHFIFSSYKDQIKAVGFKVFPEQIDNHSFCSIWQWLNQHRDVKIIFLTRQDLLATHTSRLIARKDGKYGIRTEEQRSTTTVKIDPKNLLEELEKRKYYNEEVKKYVKDHEFMEITYEELTQNISYYLTKIQEFIGVDVHDLTVKSIKQETRSLENVIENYDELKLFFKATEWEYFFQ